MKTVLNVYIWYHLKLLKINRKGALSHALFHRWRIKTTMMPNKMMMTMTAHIPKIRSFDGGNDGLSVVVFGFEVLVIVKFVVDMWSIWNEKRNRCTCKQRSKTIYKLTVILAFAFISYMFSGGGVEGWIQPVHAPFKTNVACASFKFPTKRQI